jgi:hypothetical protein
MIPYVFQSSNRHEKTTYTLNNIQNFFTKHFHLEVSGRKNLLKNTWTLIQVFGTTFSMALNVIHMISHDHSPLGPFHYVKW